MDDLISRRALLAEMELDEPDSVDENNPEIKGMRSEWRHWKKKIKRFPAVDAVALPLKIGEKVFCLHHSKSEILEDVVEDYDIWSIKNGIKLRIFLEKNNSYVIGEFGRGVFRTKEEAEKALEERENK